MKISVDTKEDSHEDLKKVIKMLQHIVGDSGEVFTNQPPVSDTSAANPFANIFGDASSLSSPPSAPETASADASAGQASVDESSGSPAPSASESTDDLFAELFSEEEIKKMDSVKAEEDEEEVLETKPKSRKYDIEFY